MSVREAETAKGIFQREPTRLVFVQKVPIIHYC